MNPRGADGTASSPAPWVYRSVVFDLDGLLVDSEPVFEETARRLLSRRGKALCPDVFRCMMGSPARQALEDFRRGHGLTESVAELTAESAQLFFEVLDGGRVALMPGALELLARLEERGIPKAIATSSGAAYLHHVLGPHGLTARFAFVLTCDDVVHGKPHPEIYLLAAARLGHDPAEMVVLEDSPNGVRAAKAAGARCVAVPHERVERTAVAGADAVVPSLAAPELWRLLGL